MESFITRAIATVGLPVYAA